MTKPGARDALLGVGLVGLGAGIVLLAVKAKAQPSPAPYSPPPPAPRPAMTTPPPSTDSAPWSPAPIAHGVAPTFATLLGQVNARWPRRQKAADGTLPSDAHRLANPTSDHDRGNALDVTYDPVHGPDMDALATALLGDPRTKYIIWNRRIANKSIEGGAWRPYALTAIQTDPHTGHLHLSILDAGRDDASPWDLSSVPDAAVA